MSDHQVEPPKEATTATQNRNRDVLTSLPFGDTLDFDDASRGFIASLPDVEIRHDRGRVVWSLRDYAFWPTRGPANSRASARAISL